MGATDATTALRMGPVKLLIAILYAPGSNLDEVLDVLSKEFGPHDMVSSPYPFDVTNYYEPEMGANLERVIVGFENLVPPEDILPIKLRCNELEEKWLKDGGRSVNIDPGYIDFFKLVLASNKPSGKKLAIGRGVWLDLNLIYEKGKWIDLPWTFPDFKSGRYDEFLNRLRRRYKEQMRLLLATKSL